MRKEGGVEVEVGGGGREDREELQVRSVVRKVPSRLEITSADRCSLLFLPSRLSIFRRTAASKCFILSLSFALKTDVASTESNV